MGTRRFQYLLASLLCYVLTSFFSLHKSSAAKISGTEKVSVYSTRTPDLIGDRDTFSIEITREQLIGIQDLNLADALQRFGGITIAPSGYGRRLTNAFFRGFSSRHILVLINGIEVNDPSNPSRSIDLSRIPLSFVDNIKIHKGPQSGYFGSDSIGGVVSVTTRSKGSNPVEIDSTLGSNNALSLNSSQSVSDVKSSFNLHQSYAKSDGISAVAKRIGGEEKDGFEEYSFHGDFRKELDDDIEIAFYGLSLNQRVQDDVFSTPIDDKNAFSKKYLFYAHLAASKTSINSHHSLSISSTSSRTRSINTPDGQSNNQYNELNFGRYIGIKEQSTFNLTRNQIFSFGIDYEYEDFKNANLQFTRTQNEWSAGAFTSYKFLLQNWSLFANLRGDLIQDEAVLTGKLSLSNYISKLSKLSISYATGYKAPSLYERFGQFGNSKLKSERAESIELQFQTSLNSGTLALGLFSTHLTNEVRFLNSQFENSGSFKNEGIDLEFSQRLFSQLGVSFNLSLLNSKSKSTGKQALRRPFTQANLSLLYDITSDFSFHLNTVYVGRRQDVDYLSFAEKDLKSILVTHLNFDYKASTNLNTQLRIDNVFNKEYELIDGYGFSRLSFYLGLKWIFS